jgi:hypothetical protein
LYRNVRLNRAAAQASAGHFIVMSAGQMRQKTGAGGSARQLVDESFQGREWNERTRCAIAHLRISRFPDAQLRI